MINQTSNIKISSINFWRCSSAHEIALQTVLESRADVLLVQELYTYRELDRRITRKYPSFNCVIPIDDRSIRPHVLTYSRNYVGLTFTKDRSKFLNYQGVSDILFFTGRAPRISHSQLSMYTTHLLELQNQVPLWIPCSLWHVNFLLKTLFLLAISTFITLTGSPRTLG